MATTRISITLLDSQLEGIREIVAGGRARSVSAFIKHAVGIAIFDAAGWRETLSEALQQPAAGSQSVKGFGLTRFSLHKDGRRKSAGAANDLRLPFDAGGLIGLDRDDSLCDRTSGRLRNLSTQDSTNRHMLHYELAHWRSVMQDNINTNQSFYTL
jgi:hypothetical protein